MIELLFIGILVGVTGLTGSSGSDDDSDENNTDIDLPNFNSDLFKPGNRLTHTRYWENSSTGDYVRHNIDIDIDD